MQKGIFERDGRHARYGRVWRDGSEHRVDEDSTNSSDAWVHEAVHVLFSFPVELTRGWAECLQWGMVNEARCRCRRKW